MEICPKYSRDMHSYVNQIRDVDQGNLLHVQYIIRKYKIRYQRCVRSTHITVTTCIYFAEWSKFAKSKYDVTESVESPTGDLSPNFGAEKKVGNEISPKSLVSRIGDKISRNLHFRVKNRAVELDRRKPWRSSAC